MTSLDIDQHTVAVREARTGKMKHPPLRDLVDALNALPLKGTPGPDPRIDGLTNEVSVLRERISALGNGSPSEDPRVDDLLARVAWIEEAMKSLIVRAISEAEA